MYAVNVTSPAQLPLVSGCRNSGAFGYLQPLGTFWIPWTFRCPLYNLNLYVPFGYLGPLGNFWIHWTFRHLLDTLDL